MKALGLFVTRAGMAIMAATFSVAVYASVVNAVAFFLLDRLTQIDVVSGAKYHAFAEYFKFNVWSPVAK